MALKLRQINICRYHSPTQHRKMALYRIKNLPKPHNMAVCVKFVYHTFGIIQVVVFFTRLRAERLTDTQLALLCEWQLFGYSLSRHKQKCGSVWRVCHSAWVTSSSQKSNYQSSIAWKHLSGRRTKRVEYRCAENNHQASSRMRITCEVRRVFRHLFQNTYLWTSTPIFQLFKLLV